MPCPYLKQLVMLSCDAFHLKKMLPLDRLATGNPCLGEFHICPFYQECTARMTNGSDFADTDNATRKDGSQ